MSLSDYGKGHTDISKLLPFSTCLFYLNDKKVAPWKELSCFHYENATYSKLWDKCTQTK